jgi:PEP-CTERM motif
MRRLRIAGLTLAAVFLAAGPAPAQILLSSGIGNDATSRSAYNGPGQEISVGTNTFLGSFGFWMDLGTSANVDFMIWDATNSTLLASDIESFGPTAGFELLTSGPVNFNLTGGDSYYFGVMADQAANISFFFPEIGTCQNTLCFIGDNSNYLAGAGFDSPYFDGFGAASIALQLNGPEGVVPEPSSLALLATGLFGMVGAARRRRWRRV